MEEQSRKLRNIVVEVEKNKEEIGGISLEKLKKFFSCDVNWMANVVVNSTWWHVKAMAENAEFMNHVRNVTESSFLDENTMYFSEFLVLRKRGAERVVSVRGIDVRERNMDAQEYS